MLMCRVPAASACFSCSLDCPSQFRDAQAWAQQWSNGGTRSCSAGVWNRPLRAAREIRAPSSPVQGVPTLYVQQREVTLALQAAGMRCHPPAGTRLLGQGCTPGYGRTRAGVHRQELCCPVPGRWLGNIPPSPVLGLGHPVLHSLCCPTGREIPVLGGLCRSMSWRRREIINQINRLINSHVCTPRISYFQRDDAAASGRVPRSHQPGRAEPSLLGTGASAAGQAVGHGTKHSKSCCTAVGSRRLGQGPA